MITRYVTSDEVETMAVAGRFAGTLVPGDVVGLSGELGAGKTVFVRGVSRALGAGDAVTSPTFTLINEYPAEPALFHMDFYRLSAPREILDLGVDDYFYGDGVCLVEWPEKLGDAFPSDAIRVTIVHREDGRRAITIEKSERQ